jgi:hypothetical protein
MTKKSKPIGVNGSGFSKQDWEHLEALAEKDPVIWSVLELLKIIFSRAHIDSFNTLRETIEFLNESLKQVTSLPKEQRPNILSNNQEKEFDSILKVAASIPKLNVDLALLKDNLFSDEDVAANDNISLSDKWANAQRK